MKRIAISLALAAAVASGFTLTANAAGNPPMQNDMAMQSDNGQHMGKPMQDDMGGKGMEKMDGKAGCTGNSMHAGTTDDMHGGKMHDEMHSGDMKSGAMAAPCQPKPHDAMPMQH